MTYFLIVVLLLVLELAYFRIADKFNIIDKPNERSSHSTIVLRGGGIIVPIGVLLWFVMNGGCYPWFVAGLLMVCTVSFVDDIRSLPDAVRLVAQFAAVALMFWEIWLGKPESLILTLGMTAVTAVVAAIVVVGATNVINFMDGINGITGGYALAVLVPLVTLNKGFIEPHFLWVVMLALAVFCWFNFRPRGRAKCFAGDVGSIGVGFVLLFAIGRLVMATGDVTWLILLLVYGVDGCLTIVHRIMLHENLGEAHRKHAYQLMANELGMSHPTVSLLYMTMQLVVSLGFIFVCPDTVAAHWAYLLVSLAVLCMAYVLFMRKYYHLHEEYLKSKS